jgi:hypothetical protein
MPPPTLKAHNSVRLPTPIVGVCFSQLFNQVSDAIFFCS